MQPHERTYRSLLPAESLSAFPGNLDSGSRQIPIESDLQSRSKRGTNQRWACDSCRTRKIAVRQLPVPISASLALRLYTAIFKLKPLPPNDLPCDVFEQKLMQKKQCDGQLPACTAWRRQGKSECMYPKRGSLPDEEALYQIDELKMENRELRERLQEAERLVNLLRSNQEFRSLEGAGHRSYGNRPAVASRGSGESSAPGPGPGDEAQEPVDRSILPPIQSSFEFELMARHPISYPTLVPVEAAHIPLKMLFRPELALSERLRRDDR